MIRRQRSCDTVAKIMSNDGSGTANYRFDCCGDIGGEIVIGDVSERPRAAANTSGLRQNRFIACAH